MTETMTLTELYNFDAFDYHPIRFVDTKKLQEYNDLGMLSLHALADGTTVARVERVNNCFGRGINSCEFFEFFAEYLGYECQDARSEKKCVFTEDTPIYIVNNSYDDDGAIVQWVIDNKSIVLSLT